VSPGRRFAIALAVIALAGLGLRVAFSVVDGDRALKTGDAWFYYHSALQLADGDGFVRPYELLATPSRRVPTAEHPPLYSLVLAAPAAAGLRSLRSLEIVTDVIGALGVAAIGLLGRRVAGDTVGLVSATVAAGYPILVQPAGLLFSESLYVLLIALVLTAAWSVAARPAVRGWAVLGALIGLAALTRAEAVLLVVLLVVPLAGRHRRALGVKRALVGASCAAAAVAVVVAPWTIRNAAVFGSFVPISNNSATALDGANCGASYHGVGIGGWDLICAQQAAVANGPQSAVIDDRHDEAERLAEWRDVAFTYMSKHLSRLPVVMAVRVARTWGFWNPSTLLAYDDRDDGVRPWQIAGVVMFYAMIPLAVAGAVVLRKRRAPLWILGMPVALVTVVSAALHGATRFRAAAEPVLIVLTAVAVHAVATAWRTRDQSAPANTIESGQA
jgi:hypothetical protein